MKLCIGPPIKKIKAPKPKDKERNFRSLSSSFQKLLINTQKQNKSEMVVNIPIVAPAIGGTFQLYIRLSSKNGSNLGTL